MKTILRFGIILSFLFSSINLTMAQTNEDKSTALLIIDIQAFYFPEGAVPLVEPEKAAEKAKEILSYFREQNLTIIHVRHNVKSGGEIHLSVSPKENEKVISKDKANAFIGTELLEYLNNNRIKNIVLCGMQTHMCLEAATRAASDYGFKCIVIEDACTTRDLKFGGTIVKASDVHYSTLSTLKNTYAKILTAKEYLKTKDEN